MTLNKLVFKLMEEHKGLFILYGLILLCVPLRDILMPRLVGSLYDAIRGGKQLEIIIIGIVAIIVIIQIMSVVSDFIDVKLHPAIYKLVREEMTKHIFSVKENNYSEVQIGDIVSKIIKLPGVIHHHIELIRETIIPSIITVLCILGYMFYIDPVLAIPLIIFICIFVGTLIYSSEKCSPVAFKKDETHSLIMSNTDDILRNMITILSFNKIDAEFERINQIHKAYEVHTMDTLNCSLRSKYIIIPCIITFMIFTWYYTYKKVVTKEVSSGTFLTIVIISFMLMNLVLSFLRAWQHILLRNGIIENSLQVFQECKVTRQPYTKPAESTAGIRFQNVDFSYVSTDISPLQPSVKRPIFKDFNLDINLYEKTLIIGEIGSGKSTIISLLLKYQTPQGGEIFLKGVPYSTIPNSTVRKNISYIPQSPILLNRSVYENIVYGITPEPSKEEVAKLIIDMKLSKFLDGLPKGLDTSVGVHGSKLSGGQKQITWILKAILINPEIIIMDEPTSAVDDETKGIIHFLLEKVMQGKTVIMITHDPYLLKFANRVIKLKDGKVVS